MQEYLLPSFKTLPLKWKAFYSTIKYKIKHITNCPFQLDNLTYLKVVVGYGNDTHIMDYAPNVVHKHKALE